MIIERKWIQKLTRELKKPLPGTDAQLRLSPPHRIIVKSDRAKKDSAVLIVLYSFNDKVNIVFIKRTEYDGVHSGQVSLPGGMHEKTDTDLKDTALRETEEETGVAREQIEVIGKLTALHIPVSNITVFPFVGVCYNRPDFAPDPVEVKYLIEVSLDDLLNPLNQKFKIMKIGDNEIEIPYFDVRDEHIWGATAMIMSEFLEIVKRLK